MAGLEYEQKYWWEGKEFVAGLDEAGRGSIAGPLVVGCVIFPPFYDNRQINDSKMLTDRQRRKMFDIIKKDAVAWTYEIISVEDVDSLNIYKATQIGMERCLKKINSKIEAILTDAMPLPTILNTPLEAIIKGDQKSISIAAASIVAKVTRDDIMLEYAKQYPGYNFEHNKGYCTEFHVDALSKLGILPIHRKTYAPVNQYIAHDVQISIDDILVSNK